MADHLTTCPACSRQLRWSGSLLDQPACACGHQPTREQLERDQRAVDQLLAALVPPVLESPRAR